MGGAYGLQPGCRCTQGSMREPFCTNEEERNEEKPSPKVRPAIPVRVLAPKLPPTFEYAGPQAGPN